MSLFGSKKTQSELPEMEHEPPKKPGPFAWLRARFFAGVIIVAPVAITLTIVFWLIGEVDRRFKPLIPPEWNPESLVPFSIPGLGLIVALALLTLIGAIGTNLIGRSFISLADRFFSNVPLVRNIYSLFKQLFEVFGSNTTNNFKEMVLVEYPKKGTWCVGFVSGEVRGEIRHKLGDGILGVFVPTTPNPTSGFYMFLPENEVIRLDMTVEDGAKLIVSAGMVIPEYVPPETIHSAIETHEAAQNEDDPVEVQEPVSQSASGA
ncbi:MAG: DUF502 domain-containing protein [Pseudomonadota bacterium]